MNCLFRQLSRMNYGEALIKASKKDSPDFVDEISFEVKGSDVEGGFSEATIKWIPLCKNKKPSPRIEIFGDGISAAYSHQFFKAIKSLSSDPDFTPEMCCKALEESGFIDVSDIPANHAESEPFNLRTALHNFFTRYGYTCYIEEPWFENDSWLVIQNSGSKTGSVSVKTPLTGIFRFASEHANPFIPELAAISCEVYLGLDGENDNELTGTWTYKIFMPEHNGDKEVFETIKNSFQDAIGTNVVTMPDYKSYDNGNFRVCVVANKYKNDDEASYEITEYCPHCDKETTVIRNVKKDGYVSVCNHCGKLIMLCSECLSESNVCDWSECGCYRCTEEEFFDFLVKEYEGSTGHNDAGEYFVDIPLASGRSVKTTYKTVGLEKEERYYDIAVLCSEAEAETEQFKNTRIVITNSYKSVSNVYNMIKTLCS